MSKERTGRNVAALGKLPGWQGALFPLLARVPAALGERSEAQNKVYQWTMNFLGNVHANAFEERGNMGDVGTYTEKFVLCWCTNPAAERSGMVIFHFSMIF